jgi:DNA-binding CsgD family transcriptional regulator
MLACDLAGDDERPRQWSQVVDAFVRRYDHVPLLAFCRTCCADVYAATGRIDDAEHELLAAIRELTDAGQSSRCAHPASKLAEIRVLQGRFEEAEELLEGFDDEPDAVMARAALRLARGEADAAAAVLERRLDEFGPTNVLASQLLGLLVQARLALGDRARAADAAERLERLALGRQSDRTGATALVASARVAAADGTGEAPVLLARAAEQLTRAGLPLEAARARLELARTLAPSAPEIAVDELRRAHRELDDLGALREAGLAAAFLRELGAKARSGPREQQLLTRREREVLRLLAEGLSNGEIARRLFISPKTAEHHVGRIYAKLNLRSRGEAAAYAARNLGVE